jgi:hypothetical protein
MPPSGVEKIDVPLIQPGSIRPAMTVLADTVLIR